MITDVPGVRVGHWSDATARTGCSVVLLPSGTVASGDVRGGAPGTREWALLDPRRTVDKIDAVVLTGGSAFGLAACDGVARWCEERGIGWPTPAGPVPIVVGMVIYDLAVGDPKVRPGPAEGYSACQTAVAGTDAAGNGRIGAACGATVGKWRGRDGSRPGALGSASITEGDLVVAALMVVNALGEAPGRDGPRIPSFAEAPVEATTIGIVVTNGRLDKASCRLVAESAHDGLARALDPVHTAADGDALVAAATCEVDATRPGVQAMAAWVVEKAVSRALSG
jgi:L-aminopeptidase/D-esterase-like protein